MALGKYDATIYSKVLETMPTMVSYYSIFRGSGARIYRVGSICDGTSN